MLVGYPYQCTLVLFPPPAEKLTPELALQWLETDGEILARLVEEMSKARNSFGDDAVPLLCDRLSSDLATLIDAATVAVDKRRTNSISWKASFYCTHCAWRRIARFWRKHTAGMEEIPWALDVSNLIRRTMENMGATGDPMVDPVGGLCNAE